MALTRYCSFYSGMQSFVSDDSSFSFSTPIGDIIRNVWRAVIIKICPSFDLCFTESLVYFRQESATTTALAGSAIISHSGVCLFFVTSAAPALNQPLMSALCTELPISLLLLLTPHTLFFAGISLRSAFSLRPSDRGRSYLLDICQFPPLSCHTSKREKDLYCMQHGMHGFGIDLVYWILLSCT